VFLYIGLYFHFICGQSNAAFFKLFLFQVKEQRVKAATQAPIQFCCIPLLSGKTDQVCSYPEWPAKETLPCARFKHQKSRKKLSTFYFFCLFPHSFFPHLKLQTTSNIIMPLAKGKRGQELTP